MLEFLSFVVISATLGWMVWVRYRDSRPHISVEIGPVGRTVGQTVTITVRNPTPNPVEVTGLSVHVSGPGVGTSHVHLSPGPVGSTIPGTVQGNGYGTSWLLLTQLPMHTVGWSLRAEVIVGHLAKPSFSKRLVWDTTARPGGV